MTLAQVDQILDMGDDLAPPWAVVDRKNLGHIWLIYTGPFLAVYCMQ